MPITYNSGTNTITANYATGDPIGNSAVNPLTLTGIYNASVAGGWGVIDKNNELFNLRCKITINGVNTYFESKYEQIYWNDSLGTNVFSVIYIMGLNLLYSDFKGRNYGNTISFNADGTIIGCTFNNIRYVSFYGYSNVLNVKSVRIVRSQIAVYNSNPNISINNLSIMEATYSIATSGWPNEGIKIIDSSYGIYTYLLLGGTHTFVNITLVNTGGIAFRPNKDRIRDIYIIDSNFGTDYTILTGTNGIDTAYFQSTFKWHLGNDTAIKLYDKNSNLVVDKIVDVGDEDIVSFWYHTVEVNGNTIVTDVMEDLYPFTLVASKEGYEDLVIPDINIIAGQPTIIRGELVLTPPLKPEITGVTIIQSSSQTATDGQITIIAASGTLPYEYSLNGTDWQATGVFSGLVKGTYEVHVKDDNDLTDSINGIEVPGGVEITYFEGHVSGTVTGKDVNIGNPLYRKKVLND